MSNLPEAYWDGLYNKLVSALNEAPLSQWNASGADPFKVISLPYFIFSFLTFLGITDNYDSSNQNFGRSLGVQLF